MSALVTLGKISGLSDFSCLAFKFLASSIILSLSSTDKFFDF